MMPLLPDLERQLRRVVRDRQAGQSANPPARPQRRAIAFVATAAVITVAAVIALAAGVGAGPSLSEAQALQRAADAAERGLAAPSLAPGEYWYVSSVTAGTTGYGALESPALIQSRQSTETWQSAGGSGRERTITDGLPLFFGTQAARARFRGQEANAPKPVPVDQLIAHSIGFRSPLGILTYSQVQALPTTPGTMLQVIRHAAEHSLAELQLQAPGSPVAEESLAQTELESISGILADLPLSPQQRAGTYRAMEKLPGVIYIPHVTDALGRSGAALASNGLHYRFIDGSGQLSTPASVREELIFEPSTGVLLAQQRVLLSSIPSVGLPAGYAVQYTAYVSSGVVASTTERFVKRGLTEVVAPAAPAPACTNEGPPATQLVAGAVPAALAGRFAALRRPQTSEELKLANGSISETLSTLELARVLRSSVRILQTHPAGVRYYMVVGYRRSFADLGGSAGCSPPATGTQHRLELAAQQASRRAAVRPVVCVIATEGPIAFPCAEPSELDTIGYETSDYGRPPAVVTGIIPDGVAKVEAIYPHRRTVLAAVTDNLLIYRVNLPAPNAAPKEVRWLGSSGEVVRRITSR
jgi:hypothetical protein